MLKKDTREEKQRICAIIETFVVSLVTVVSVINSVTNTKILWLVVLLWNVKIILMFEMNKS